MGGPAYRAETARLVLRCWAPADAPLLTEAIEASVEHLLPWMDWIRGEPRTPDERIELLRGFRSRFDAGAEFVTAILDREERRVLGGTGLMPRVGPGNLEVGYWLRPDAQGRGYATESTAAMARLAFEVHGVHRLELRCDPANHRSAAVARRLAFTLEGTLRANAPGVDGTGRRDTQVWALLADEYPASPAACLPLAAFDAAGRPLPLRAPA